MDEHQTPSALFGGMLWGDRAMRFVFCDEAGTSDPEPETVVVGLVVDADRQLLTAERAIAEVLRGVPTALQKDFVFHAKEVWGNPAYREAWSMADRLALLKAMMSLPRRLGIPVVLARVSRTWPVEDHLRSPLSLAQYHHFFALAGCLASADRYIRDFAAPSEVATAVVEDVPDIRRFLAFAPRMFGEMPWNFGPNGIRPTEQEERQGFVTQRADFRVERIRKGVHFVKKGEDPALLMSDACAFGFRRYFARETFGDDFVNAIIGGPLNRPDFAGPSSFINFSPDVRH